MKKTNSNRKSNKTIQLYNLIFFNFILMCVKLKFEKKWKVYKIMNNVSSKQNPTFVHFTGMSTKTSL